MVLGSLHSNVEVVGLATVIVPTESAPPFLDVKEIVSVSIHSNVLVLGVAIVIVLNESESVVLGVDEVVLEA